LQQLKNVKLAPFNYVGIKFNDDESQSQDLGLGFGGNNPDGNAKNVAIEQFDSCIAIHPDDSLDIYLNNKNHISTLFNPGA